MIQSKHPDLQDIAEQHGRMVELAILVGDRARALSLVERAFESLARPHSLDPSTPVAAVLNQRIATILMAGGVRTVADLVSHTRHTLAEIHQIRYRSIDIIEEQLAKHGHMLRRDQN
jgi:DNA-directed RNA polymerase alpha subunit